MKGSYSTPTVPGGLLGVAVDVPDVQRSGVDGPPLPAGQQQVPGSHQVGVLVHLAQREDDCSFVKCARRRNE